jgi:hypothetical protein
MSTAANTGTAEERAPNLSPVRRINRVLQFGWTAEDFLQPDGTPITQIYLFDAWRQPLRNLAYGACGRHQ